MDKHCPLAVQGLQVKQQHLFFPPTQKLCINVPLGWSPPALPARGAKHHDPASQSSVPAHQHCRHGELSPPRGCRYVHHRVTWWLEFGPTAGLALRGNCTSSLHPGIWPRESQDPAANMQHFLRTPCKYLLPDNPTVHWAWG